MKISKIDKTEDSYIVENFIQDKEFLSNITVLLEQEIIFGNHYKNNKPLAVFQADKIGDSYSYLRCPSIKPEILDNFTPSVDKIRTLLNDKFEVKTNIAKILKYQNNNSLKNHADKIIDLEEGSNIYTIRFGATRPLLLINKTTNEEILLKLPNNSMMILGWETNRHWTHGIPKISEFCENGITYSIVLRTSVTFLHQPTMSIWGPRTNISDICKLSKNNLIKKDPNEIIRLWGIENKMPVNLDHYKSLQML